MQPRPCLYLSLPQHPDAARLQSVLSARGSRDVVVVPDVPSLLREVRATTADAVVVGWPVEGMDPDKLVQEVGHLPRRPALLVLVPPDQLDAALGWWKGQEDRVQAVVPMGPGEAFVLERMVADTLEMETLRRARDQSARQYLDLLQNTRDAIYILGPTRFTFVNRAFEELMGYAAEEICNPDYDYQRLIAPESRPMILERARLAARGDPLPPRYEFIALNRSGQRLDVAVSVSYIDYNGEPSSLGVMQDITARKQYEKALLRRNRELAVLNDLAATVSRAPDLSTVLEMAVERLIAVMGFDAAGISLLESGRSVVRAQRFRGVRPEGVDLIREIPASLGLLNEAVRTGDVQVVRDLRTDPRASSLDAGKSMFRAAVCVPIQAKDRVLGSAIGLCLGPRDFAPEEVSLLLSLGHQLGTAVERAALYDRQEAAMQRMVALDEVARALSSTLDRQDVFRVAASQVQRVLTADTVELSLLRQEGDGSRTMEVVLQWDRRGKWQEPARVVEEGQGLRWKALSSARPILLDASTDPAGQEFRAGGIRSVAAAPLMLEGQAMGVVLAGFVNDIGRGEAALEFLGPVSAHLALAIRNARMFSSMEEAYSELKKTKDRLVLQEKLSALGEMSAGVAHDFNNVLGAILGRTQLLKTFIQDPSHLRSLDVIERAALDGAATVRRIQEFARSGGDESFHPVQLDDVVTEAVELTQPRWQDRARAEGGEIKVLMDKGCPAAVMGKPQELREVLTNLIHNACDAMPNGGIIEIATGVVRGRSFVSVSDTGIGMPSEVRARVFDPFFTTKGVKGTGLGLSVSYGIVQRHHGEFELFSEQGQGSTFTFWLPVAPEGAVDQSLAEQAPTEKVSGARVLVIDDEESIRDILADMLRAGEHDAVVAADGKGGLQVLDELMAGQGLDAVFTDLGMPGMTGWEVAKEVHRRYPSLPVGLITGWGASIDAEQMRLHSVDLLVPKPFKFEQLMSVVAEAVKLKQARNLETVCPDAG